MQHSRIYRIQIKPWHILGFLGHGIFICPFSKRKCLVFFSQEDEQLTNKINGKRMLQQYENKPW